MKEISTVEEFVEWASGSPECDPAAIQDLNLTSQVDLIKSNSFSDSIFLSCNSGNVDAGRIVQTGGVVIPDLAGFRFSDHRKSLYSVGELFDGFDIGNPDGHKTTYDYQVYDEYVSQGKSPRLINTSLARRLHDHSITDALGGPVERTRQLSLDGRS